MKRIDFPVKPYLLKYLQVNLELARLQDDPYRVADYVLSRTGRFDLALTQLLRKPPKSARHQGSTKDCTAMLGVDLRNFPYPYYDLLQGNIPAYCVFQFNDFVDANFKRDLYWWVGEQYERRATIKDAIQSFMALFDIREEDVAYETLRKSVQRKVSLKRRKKTAPKSGNFSMNLSRKMDGLSRKVDDLSQKTGVLSQKDTFEAVRQELMKLPLAIFETTFYHARS